MNSQKKNRTNFLNQVTELFPSAGKKECPQEIHNTTDDLRRVLKGGGGVSGGARSFSGGARSFSGGSHGYSSETEIGRAHV